MQNKLKELWVLNNNTKIPCGGYGLYNISKVDQLPKLIDKALEIGYRHFDTARMYKNEKEVGKCFQDVFSKNVFKREDIYITTKGFPDKNKSLVDTLKEALSDL